jgi:hypothetical protein
MKLWTIPRTADNKLLHTFYAANEGLTGVGFNGRDRLFAFGDAPEWRMWFISQDRNPIDLREALL